jgi:hypothetical protein
MKKKILIALVVVLVLIQFIRIDRSHPEISADKDFIAITQPEEKVEKLLRSACYDCHSYETEYPWYANVAPVSWFVGHHIDEGREHLNFSIWGDYEPARADHKLEESAEEVEEGEMPLNSYTWTHGDAKLSKAEKALLEEFFESKMRSPEDVPEALPLPRD